LYYFNARYYDPNLGRFISEDPMKDGANWYSYCANNPLKYVDPTGEVVLAIDGGAQAAAIVGGEGGVTFAIDTLGNYGWFGHAGFQFQIGASAGGAGGAIFSHTMKSIDYLKGATFWFGYSRPTGLPFVSKGANYGITFGGDKLTEYAFGAGTSIFPVEGHLYIDYTWPIGEFKQIDYDWVDMQLAGVDFVSIRAENGVTYVRCYMNEKSFVITHEKTKVYQLGGANSGQLLDTWGGE
ncbi:MAG: RHS repeat-associated core domain-containing protein, partial [Halanaerobiales bacterium]|nr:RHS repeat-associated core domain-containing protein [Halanaerobiales bacterium]